MSWYRRLLAHWGASSSAFFADAVSDAFTVLLKAEWTMSVGKNHNFGHRAELRARGGRITITTDYREGLGVLVEPKDADGKFVPEWPGLRVELAKLLSQRGVSFEPHSATGWLAGDELRAELRRHADALLRACPELVDGDFSKLPIRRWPPVLDRAE